jgi:hypothetical protein
MQPAGQTVVYTGWIFAIIGYFWVKHLAPERRWLGFWLGALGIFGLAGAIIIVTRKLNKQRTEAMAAPSLSTARLGSTTSTTSQYEQYGSTTAPPLPGLDALPGRGREWQTAERTPADESRIRPWIAVALGVVGMLILAGFIMSAVTSKSTNASAPARSVVTAPPVTAPWYPSDYQEAARSMGFAWKFITGTDSRCAGSACWNVAVIPAHGCGGGIRVYMDVVDSDNNLVGQATGSMSADVRAGQSALLTVDDTFGPGVRAGDPTFMCGGY